MSFQEILEEFGSEMKLQHSVWVECLLLLGDYFYSVVVSESQRLNSVLIDVHPRLAQLRRSEVLSLANTPAAVMTSSVCCLLHATLVAVSSNDFGFPGCRRCWSCGSHGSVSRGSPSLPASDLHHFLSGPLKSGP